MLEKDFTLHQEALALKELGFDEPCLGFFSASKDDNRKFMYATAFPKEGMKLINNSYGINTVTAPTYSQAFRFFREKYNLVHRIDRDGGWWVCAILDLYDEKEQGTIENFINCYPNTYEEAELACLRKLIEIVNKM